MASNDRPGHMIDQQLNHTLSTTAVSSTDDSKDPSSAKHQDKHSETIASNDDTASDEKQNHVEEKLKDGALAASEEEYPKAARLFFILLALALSIFLVSLDMTIIATAIPRITDEFHSLNDVGWYGTAFFLTLAR